jgi:uncharacterized membrane protein
MSEPLQIRVSRDGQEIGTYAVQEAIRQVSLGQLKPTDFYWHEGMTEWAPLSQLQASEARRQLAEIALQRKQAEERKAEQLAREKALKDEQLARERAKAKEEEDRAVAEAVRIRREEEKAKAKEEEEAISTEARALKVKKMASARLDENSGCFMAVGVAVILIGGVVLLIALAGDDAGSAIRQQVRTQQMTNGILLLILGYIITKR